MEKEDIESLSMADVIAESNESTAENLPDSTEPNVDDVYSTLDTYTRMAARGEKEGVLVESRPGIGKSHQIEEILQEEVANDDVSCWSYTFQSGYVSPLSLYETLYEEQHDGNVLVLDDVEGVASSETAAALLKAALEGAGSGDERWVSWESKSSKLPEDVPEKFQFRGSIIMIFNDIPEGNKHWEAVKSRCFDYEFTMTFEERMDLIWEVAKADHPELDYAERMETAKWLIDNTTSDMDHVDLRALFHAFDLRTSSVIDDEEWKLHAAEQIGIDKESIVAQEIRTKADTIVDAAEAFAEMTHHPSKRFFEVLGEEVELTLVKELYDEYNAVQDGIEKYKELTANGRRTFYNRRDELIDRGEL